MRPAGQAASRLVGKVFEIKGAHRALQADMKLGDLAFGQGDDPDARVLGKLVEARDILKVAGEAIEALGENDIHLAGPHGIEKGLVSWPMRGRVGYGGVVEATG